MSMNVDKSKFKATRAFLSTDPNINTNNKTGLGSVKKIFIRLIIMCILHKKMSAALRFIIIVSYDWCLISWAEADKNEVFQATSHTQHNSSVRRKCS